MKTPLETIKEGQEELSTVDWMEKYDFLFEAVEAIFKTQLDNLLKALIEELEGEKYDENSEETWFFQTIWEVRAFNYALQKKIDDYEKLRKSL